jgi:choline dehydrogenase-like flavoprotein
MKKQIFDVCVIGTGAGGGVMIDQLTAAGLSVVALERGPFLPPSEFDDDELRNSIRDEVFSANQLETYRSSPEDVAQPGKISDIAHCVGGTMTHWAAWSWRFRPDEFRVLSMEGSIAGASLADWPIDYTELEPWYEKAEWDFGVSGLAGSNPFEGSRRKAYPNPAHPPRVGSLRFSAGSKKAGYTPFPVPMAINSKVYGNRPACIHGGACRAYGCPIGAKGTTYSVSLPKASRTGKLDLRPDATVFDLPLKNGKVTGAKYLDNSGKEHEVHARQVVVSAGSIGTPHLLLMSSSGTFPAGLANSSGQVGRHLSFHHHPSAAGLLDEDIRSYTGLETHRAFDDLHPSDARRGFIRGGVVAELNTFTHQPIAHALALPPAPSNERLWGSALKRHISSFARTMVVAGICEELPMADNRVDLDPTHKDRFGLPVPRITKRQHANDVAMYRWYEKKLTEVVDASGATTVWPGRAHGVHIGDGHHQRSNAHNHGTCRMGNNPSDSVLDRWCRSHEVPNLWVVDGSFMPTNGGYNPTLTILANAYRVADHFITEAKRLSL